MNNIRRAKDEFIENLNNVEEFIMLNNELSRIINSICSGKSDDKEVILDEFKKKHLRIINTPVTYNAVIISIYGCFEAYIDRISSLLLDFWMENANDYSQISKSIRNKHIQKCGDFLSNPQRYQNIDITKERVVKNLAGCLNGERIYSLNKELILSHSGNLNSSQLMRFFTELGIKNCKAKILKHIQYIEYISRKFEMSNEEAMQIISARNSDDRFLFKELTQLVEQRNGVAHGWSVDQRLSKVYLVENVIPFMKMLGCVIAEIFINEFAKIMYLTGSLKEFDNAINIYNKRVLCINSKDANLKCKEYIFANDGKTYMALNIMELQKNNKSVEEIIGENIDVGILVDKDIKKNWRFYYA